MSVAFNIPSSTATGQGALSGSGKLRDTNGAGIFTNEDLEKDNIQQQLKYMDKLEALTKYKALDLSSTYGSGISQQTTVIDKKQNVQTIRNPLKKFHQVTMYFHNYKLSDGSYEDTDIQKTDCSYIISSNLPDNFQYKVGGQWSKPLDWMADSTVDLIVRSATGNKTLRTMASTGLLWTAPDPLELTFTIHAFDDTADSSLTNIQECLNVLGEYALPDEGECIYKNVPAGIDLGLTVNYNKKDYHIGKSVDTKEKITTKNDNNEYIHTTHSKNLDILIGGMLYVQRMSIKNFTVNYTNTKNMLLHNWKAGESQFNRRLLPMTADITITLTTVRGLSHLNYSKMLLLNNHTTATLEDQTADDSILGTITL